MRIQGKVLNWNDDKGFGFVEPIGGGDRAFVHIKAFTSRARRPVNGDVINYEVVQESNNRYKAESIKFASDMTKASQQSQAKKHSSTKKTSSTKSYSKPKKSSSLGVILTFGFCAVLLVLVLNGTLPLVVAGAYIVMSTVAFIAYAVDKSAAESGRWRTKESTLHVFALICGWPGAFFAQKMLRHKSSKQEFQTVYKVTVVLNIAGLLFLFTDQGSAFLNETILPLLAGF